MNRKLLTLLGATILTLSTITFHDCDACVTEIKPDGTYTVDTSGCYE